jgi:putative ABC transport system ATP-binding protein
MAIECKSLAKQFGGTHVLRGVDLRIEDGEYVAVMGRSGAGKSTLLNIMAGFERPTSGQVEYNGIDLGACPEKRLAELRRREFGFIFQFYNLIQELTLYENIVLSLELDGKTADEREANELIARLGLKDRTACFPVTLSGGELQRAAIARAVIHRPRVLFADEPTGNLDGETANGFLELLGDVRKRTGCTVVLVTHDAAVAACAGRVVRIADGRITEEG